MEILFALLAVGAAAWYFFRNNAKCGFEIVRSQVFLSGLHSRNTVLDANFAASFGFKEQPSHEVIQSAIALAKAEYEGKAFAIIAEAYQRGMMPRLPLWQRIIILGSLRNPYKNVPSQVRRHALSPRA